jgi:hypothetical protein
MRQMRPAIRRRLEIFNRTRSIAGNVQSFQPPMLDARLRAGSPHAPLVVADLGRIGFVQRTGKQFGQDRRERRSLLFAKRSE